MPHSDLINDLVIKEYDVKDETATLVTGGMDNSIRIWDL
jgi:WD40 repeat protein